jgi:hypothetical protein
MVSCVGMGAAVFPYSIDLVLVSFRVGCGFPKDISRTFLVVSHIWRIHNVDLGHEKKCNCGF